MWGTPRAAGGERAERGLALRRGGSRPSGKGLRPVLRRGRPGGRHAQGDKPFTTGPALDVPEVPGGAPVTATEGGAVAAGAEGRGRGVTEGYRVAAFQHEKNSCRAGGDGGTHYERT